MNERVRPPSGPYVDELLRLKCGSDLVRLKLFPNTKEVEESFAAYHAVVDALDSQGRIGVLGDRSVVAIFPGDGHVPRTAATFAYRTAWRCYSVDPCMRLREYGVERLTAVRSSVEDAPVEEYVRGASLVVVAAVHSHAKLRPLWDRVAHVPRLVISMPCCVPQNTDRAPDMDYPDYGVSSPHRRILVWRDPTGAIA